MLHWRYDILCKLYTRSKLVTYTFTFRYSLASRTLPKTKYSVICQEFLMASKFYFSQWKIHFSLFIFSEKYLKVKEIFQNISSINFKMWPALFYVNSTNFQQWNSNWDIIFQFVLRFRIGISNYGSKAVLQFFS